MHHLITTTLLTLAATAAAAAPHGDGEVPLEQCLKAASAIRPGAYVKVEYLSVTDEGGSAWEIEVRSSSGDWEFECDSASGRIIEVEQEVDGPDHPLFAGRAVVSEAQARQTALRLYPGTVDEVEYEIEVDGTPSYEFDVVDQYGVEFKIEVNAVSGEIDEVQIELWEIGLEDTD